MALSDMSRDDMTALADRLRRLHWQLEDEKPRNEAAWSKARMLEDRIGSFGPLPDDIEDARDLLARFKM